MQLTMGASDKWVPIGTVKTHHGDFVVFGLRMNQHHS